MSKRLLTYLMALATVTLWGASFPLTKAALDALGPTSLAFLRWAVSAVVLIAWLWWGERSKARANALTGSATAAENERTPQPVAVLRAARAATAHDNTPVVNRWRSAVSILAKTRIWTMLHRDWFPVLWVSLSGITLFYWLENTALQYTTATNAGVLSNLTSVFMVLIAIAFLRERLGWLEWLAMAVAFGGAVLVSQGAGHLTLSEDGWIGDLMMVVASLFAAIYSIGGKRLSEKYSAAAVITVVAAVGAAFLLPLAILEGLHMNLPWRVWGVVLLLGVGSGALANAWWLTILARMDASRAALALFLIPVIAAGLSVLLLDEPLTPTVILGGVLVLAGVMAVQRKTTDEM